MPNVLRFRDLVDMDRLFSIFEDYDVAIEDLWLERTKFHEAVEKLIEVKLKDK